MFVTIAMSRDNG